VRPTGGERTEEGESREERKAGEMSKVRREAVREERIGVEEKGTE
jgi:hypothetical protein